MAPAIWGSGGILALSPAFSSTLLNTPTFLPIPPVTTNFSSIPTRFKRAMTRLEMASCRPAKISALDVPFFSKAIASDLANTAQMVLKGIFWVDSREIGPILFSGSCKISAMISINLPVPPAHLSFMIKLVTLPFSSTRIPLQSCPPMSRIVATPGTKRYAPLAWQDISVILAWAKGTITRP